MTIMRYTWLRCTNVQMYDHTRSNGIWGMYTGAISGCLSINHKRGELLGSTVDVLLKYGLGYCLNKYAPFGNAYTKI